MTTIACIVCSKEVVQVIRRMADLRQQALVMDHQGAIRACPRFERLMPVTAEHRHLVVPVCPRVREPQSPVIRRVAGEGSAQAQQLPQRRRVRIGSEPDSRFRNLGHRSLAEPVPKPHAHPRIFMVFSRLKVCRSLGPRRCWLTGSLEIYPPAPFCFLPLCLWAVRFSRACTVAVGGTGGPGIKSGMESVGDGASMAGIRPLPRPRLRPCPEPAERRAVRRPSSCLSIKS